jgi:acyl-CoA thioesterase FadM
MKLLRPVNSFLWGNSIALSWLWGLGLFFSVQMTFLFGLTGLLGFAFLNALGLFLFGFCTQSIARRDSGGESLERFFKKWSRPFRLSFYLYQVLAITLTVFAVVNYLLIPLLAARWPGWGEQGKILLLISLSLVVLLVLSAACLVGEEFRIKSLKYGHLFQGALVAVIVLLLLVSMRPFEVLGEPGAWIREQTREPIFWGYLVPILIGFFVGPWLDLQQWQRAIQIHKENTSVSLSYFFGAALFFLLLIFHGVLAGFVLNSAWFSPGMATTAFGKLQYGHDLVVRYMESHLVTLSWWVPAGYYLFIGLAVLTTLDSGYVALKWFLTENVKASKSPLLSFVPQGIIASPIPTYIFAGFATIFAVLVKLEVEYFMVFYASFFGAYATLGIARCFVPNSQHALPQVKMFSIGSLSVVVFACGYFMQMAALMIAGSILPMVYVWWLVFNTDLLRIVTEKAEEVIDAAAEIPVLRKLSQVTHLAINGETREVGTGSHFEDKWFVHSFMATYADTNSVGNVYFGMYAMWVGKTRELFFNHVLPGFDLKTTPYYILTRSFEHKYITETREFERISVKIRVAEYNRKFATLEHQIYDSAGNLLGKGRQQLIFVASKDYKLLDIPGEVLQAFMPYL